MYKRQIQYPANWLRHSTLQEREELGITEEADPVRADDRFYWGGDVKSPKDLDGLKTQWVANIKSTANSALATSDWMELRALTRKVPVPEPVAVYRQAVIDFVNATEKAINASKSVDGLVVIVSGLQWPTSTE